MTALARGTLLVAATVLLLTAIMFASRGDWPVTITMIVLAGIAALFERLLTIGADRVQ